MGPCDGRLIRAHLIPRQLLQRELGPVEALAAIEDRRSWVMACGGPTGCGGHHGMFDQARRLRLSYEDLPPCTLDLAEELNLMWWIERTY